MKKGCVILVAIMFSLVFIAPTFAAEGPVEMVYGTGAYYVDKTCKGVSWFAENWWNCIVYAYGAVENTLYTKKLNGPKWAEEEKGKKK